VSNAALRAEFERQASCQSPSAVLKLGLEPFGAAQTAEAARRDANQAAFTALELQAAALLPTLAAEQSASRATRAKQAEQAAV
jgi:hypothetical protein